MERTKRRCARSACCRISRALDEPERLFDFYVQSGIKEVERRSGLTVAKGRSSLVLTDRAHLENVG
jgi:hypothetical protein